MRPTLLLLWGAPAAGKTSIARAVSEGYRARVGHVLPKLVTDELRRTILGAEFIAEVRNSVYDGIVAMADRIATAGLDCLIDGNYLDGWRRRQIEDVASRAGARFVRVMVHCGLEDRLARNAARPALERVPDEWVRQAHAMAEANREDADLVVDTAAERAEAAAPRILAYFARCAQPAAAR